MVDQRWTQADTLLQQAVGDVFPAAQLVVMDQLAVVHALAVGDASEHTLFDIASLTKPLCTAYLTMLLVERGVVSRRDQPRPDVSVDALLCHASGLPAWKPLWPPDAELLHERPELINHPYLGVVEQVRREPLTFTPGSRAVYSDLGFILLAAWLEQKTGQVLAEATQQKVAALVSLSNAQAAQVLS